jgi:hypothetical protein
MYLVWYVINSECAKIEKKYFNDKKMESGYRSESGKRVVRKSVYTDWKDGSVLWLRIRIRKKSFWIRIRAAPDPK